MYPERIENISCFRGCTHGCAYCAFNSTLSRAKKADKTPCNDCRTYTPHAHLEVLKKTPKKTPEGTFSTIALNGDVCFAPDEVFHAIIEYCKKWSDRTFLLQSKNPARFIDFTFPDNVMLGTTLETNRSGFGSMSKYNYYGLRYKDYADISSAPFPVDRAEAMLHIINKTTLTLEPLVDFDLEKFYQMIMKINPFIVWIGYVSKPEKNVLPEPPINKVRTLIMRLRNAGIDVREKDLRV